MKNTDRLLMPWSPYRTVVDPDTGVVATVKVGSYADYLDRVEAWLLQELAEATDPAARMEIEAAIEENREQRQHLGKRENNHEDRNA